MIGLMRLGYAQNINRVEYFIDSDPGIGKATAVTVTPASNLTTSFDINIQTLNEGVHTLYVRSKDAGNRWSLTGSRIFYKATAPASSPDIVQLAYSIDNITGITSANVTPAQDIKDFALDIDIQSLSEGIHTLYIKSKDATGKWSLTGSRIFYKAKAASATPKIIELLYSFDNASSFTKKNVATPTTDLKDYAIDIDITSLEDGEHTLYIQSKNEQGAYSLTASRVFVKNSVQTSSHDAFISEKEIVIKLYPNPANSKLFIESTEKLSDFSISDMTGREILHKDIPYNGIDISTLQTGVYFLKINSAAGISTLKFIKE